MNKNRNKTYLYHPDHDAIIVEKDSEEYNKKIAAGWATTKKTKQDLEHLDIEELRDLAKSKGMIGYGNAKRETLIKKLRS